MMDTDKKIPGIKIFTVNGERCLAIGSRTLSQSDVEEISKVSNVSKILFYSIIFKVENLLILERTSVKHLSVRHGNFSNQEFTQVCGISTINVIDIYDTLVTDECFTELKNRNSDIKISVKTVE